MYSLLARKPTTPESATQFNNHTPGVAPTILKGLTITPISPAIGAEISNIDLSQPLSEDLVGALREALLKYKIICFRGQNLNSEQHLDLGRYFGELEIHPITKSDQPNPEILRLVHDENSPGRENNWHSDVTWRPQPALGSILRAVELPPSGGDTLFANMHVAFEALPDKMKEIVCGLTAEHDIMKAFTSRFDPAVIDEMRQKHPIQTHPVIRTHPESKEQAIYVNIGFTTKINGLPEAFSNELLMHLQHQAWIPEYQCRIRWQPGTIVFWDNRASQHYAASDYWPLIRVMERVTIKGDKPFYEA